MLRTMELILGMKPMSQYDAAATPMWRSFNKSINTDFFVAKSANINLNERNVAINFNSKRSSQFDLTKPDAIDDRIFSEIVWQTVRGQKAKIPAPRRGAFVRLDKFEKDEDEDD